jgi:hypothetical protein
MINGVNIVSRSFRRAARRVLPAVVILALALMGGCMDMDGFLFNTEALDH